MNIKHAISNVSLLILNFQHRNKFENYHFISWTLFFFCIEYISFFLLLVRLCACDVWLGRYIVFFCSSFCFVCHIIFCALPIFICRNRFIGTAMKLDVHLTMYCILYTLHHANSIAMNFMLDVPMGKTLNYNACILHINLSDDCELHSIEQPFITLINSIIRRTIYAITLPPLSADFFNFAFVSTIHTYSHSLKTPWIPF